MTAILRMPVSGTCEHKDCEQNAEIAFVVSGDFGKDGVAVYCESHADRFAEPRDSHTALTTVDHE